MARAGINIHVELDRRALNWFQREAPQKLETAKKRVVEASGMVWADRAKSITREENHIDTGLYINSIGYSTGGSPSGKPINEIQNEGNQTVLKIGADVAYAIYLEKSYAIFARALDTSQERMQNVAATQVINTLGL
ncbi:HK97 gp10 family phage protein [Cytobacillus depressus]|uniref:HK97 gp10 family phage protein n=1 Tax=Cytobacillus depressus TaxID=1602942 RepID=UPI0014783585|nr:HK97 gp10 family phage protein [Cytobacillus depressus]